jgi:Mrp family chromosome partitioning ATPase
MRKPKIHIGFNAANNAGMSTILIGKTSITECIQKTNLKNLDFIPAGPIPPNPAELIISARMDETINELKKSYHDVSNLSISWVEKDYTIKVVVKDKPAA